jgi:diacylglycerol kinase family enzyme
VRLALTGEAKPMDVGRANGAVFLIMAGMGLDARMIRDADRKLKQRLGVLAYIVSVLRNIGRPHVRFWLTIDGRRVPRRAQTVLVANLGRITGGLELVPGADPEDGLLDVAVLRARTLTELAVVAWRALIGERRSDPLLEILRGREVVIETERPQPVQLDGNDVEPTSRLVVRVEPRALHLVRAPADTGADAPLVSPPVAAATRSAATVAGPLLVGAGLAALLHLRALTLRRRGGSPGLLMRHPLLTGIAAGAAALLVESRRKREA